MHGQEVKMKVREANLHGPEAILYGSDVIIYLTAVILYDPEMKIQVREPISWPKSNNVGPRRNKTGSISDIAWLSSVNKVLESRHKV